MGYKKHSYYSAPFYSENDLFVWLNIKLVRGEIQCQYHPMLVADGVS